MRYPRWVTAVGALMMMLAAGAAAAPGPGGLRFFAVLSGAQEVPAVDSQGSAQALVVFDRAFTKAVVHIDPKGPLQVVAAHFHCGRAGTNGPVAFGILNPGPLLEFADPTRVTLGNGDFTGADCQEAVGRPVNNLVALALAMRDGLVYLNLHSPVAPAGEVRGQMLEVSR